MLLHAPCVTQRTEGVPRVMASENWGAGEAAIPGITPEQALARLAIASKLGGPGWIALWSSPRPRIGFTYPKYDPGGQRNGPNPTKQAEPCAAPGHPVPDGRTTQSAGATKRRRNEARPTARLRRAICGSRSESRRSSGPTPKGRVRGRSTATVPTPSSTGGAPSPRPQAVPRARRPGSAGPWQCPNFPRLYAVTRSSKDGHPGGHFLNSAKKCG